MARHSSSPARARPSALLVVALMIAVAVSYLLWNPGDLTGENMDAADTAGGQAGAASLDPKATESDDLAVDSVQREAQDISLLESATDSLVPGAKRAWLDVQLIDVAGGDAASAQSVRLVDAHGAWPWPAVADGATDEAGKIRLNAPANRVMVLRVNPGAPMQRARLRIAPLADGETRAVELRLHQHNTTQARVVVVDAQDIPVVGAKVSALEQEFGSVVTDAQGVAVLPDIPMFTTVFLRADARGFSPGFDFIDDEQTELRVVLGPEARLLGRVFGVDGAPASNALIALRSDPLAHRIWSSSTLIEWETRSDQDGRYRIAGLPVGVALLVTAEADDAIAVVTTPTMKAGNQMLDLTLAEAPSLAGRAMDLDGNGVGGVVMELEPIHELRADVSPAPALSVVMHHQATTAADGSFEFGPELGLHAGRWKLGLLDSMRRGVRHSADVAPSYRWLPQLLEVELLPGEQKQDVLIHLRSGSYIAGILLDPKGRSGSVRRRARVPRSLRQSHSSADFRVRRGRRLHARSARGGDVHHPRE